MTRYVYDADLDAVVAVRAGSNYFHYNEKRSDLPCPAIQPGSMPAIKSMADGRIYETRRNYYKSVARAGCEIVGHDKGWERHVPAPGLSDKQLEAQVVKDVQRAWEVEAGKVPSYGPEARRLMRKQKRAERAAKV
jgi:hypothetical protein